MNTSLFAKLSPELRSCIYVLTMRQASPVRMEWDPSDQKPQLTDPCRNTHPLALTENCLQIHKECEQLFYTTNTFIFKCPHAALNDFLDSNPMTQLFAFLDYNQAVAPRAIIFDLGKLYPRAFRCVPEGGSSIVNRLDSLPQGDRAKWTPLRLRIGISYAWKNFVADIDSHDLDATCSSAIEQVEQRMLREGRTLKGKWLRKYADALCETRQCGEGE